MKQQVLKLNKNIINYDKSATWNVWRQFGVDIEKHKGSIDVTTFYMPQEVQQELRSLMLKNSKEYKGQHAQADISMEMISYFPSPSENAVKEEL